MLRKLHIQHICATIIFLILVSMIPFASAITDNTGIKVGDTTYTDIRVGDIVTYTANLSVPQLIESIDTKVIYDSKKLQLSSDTNKSNTIPNISDKKGTVTFNASKENKVMFTGSNGRFDFKEEKILVTLTFRILDTSYSEIDLQFVDLITRDGTTYFDYYNPVETEGLIVKEQFEITERAETETTKATEATEETTTTSSEENPPKKGIGIGNAVYYIADPGDKVEYRVTLKADQLFENLEATITYDSEKLELIKDAEGICPNLSSPDVNTTAEGIIKIRDSNTQGNNFAQEKVLFSVIFLVKSSDYSRIDYVINEMTIKGEAGKYFSQGTPVITDGIRLSEELSLWTAPETPPVISTSDSEPASSTSVPEPESSTTVTDETEITTAVPASSFATQATSETQAQTQSTAPSATSAETTGTDPTETTTETATIVVTYLLGDANFDNKINVKDATYIQKAAASLLTLEPIQIMAADCDGNSQVNVRDATAIQKFSAGISINMPIGEERVYQ